jgi:glycosyltransferase involved in cell wall biosynthesis
MSLMKSADLFVMSSVTEGLGSAVLDAMAMGHAVVGTTAGGIPEAVVHGRRVYWSSPRCQSAGRRHRAFVEGRDLRKQFGRSRPRARRRALWRRSAG